jgi:hypothetical protein
MELYQEHADTVGSLWGPNIGYFKHTPLNRTEGSIRLLRILPLLSVNQLIQCEITHTTTDARYECLSYQWGEKDSNHRILINDKLFMVRQNLFDFIEHMHSGSITLSNTIQLIWIDALCIDQSSMDEKNHQVAQMGTIYRNATVVKIWLGRSLQWLQPLSKQQEYYWSKRPRHVNPKQTNGEISPLLAYVYMAYGTSSSRSWNTEFDKERAAYRQILEKNFFNNEYWTRAWITQEIYVAKHPVVMLPNEEFSIATCMNVLWGCDKAAVHNNDVLKKFALFLGFDNSGLPVIQPGGTSRSLLSLLRQFSNKNCTIPRDRLYSLLSLYCNGDMVAVDYAQPDDELLCHVAECLYEPVGLCSIIKLAKSLMPQSETLGTGFIEVDLHNLVLEWGSADTAPFQCTLSQAQSQHTYYHLVNIKCLETPCVFIPKILQKLHGKAVLIESRPNTAEEPEFASYGEPIMGFTEAETGMQFNHVTPLRDRIVRPTTLRMYAHDFNIWMANQEGNLWTLRIRLSLLWSIFGTVSPMNLCDNLHRFSYRGVCERVRLGCGPLYIDSRD